MNEKFQAGDLLTDPLGLPSLWLTCMSVNHTQLFFGIELRGHGLNVLHYSPGHLPTYIIIKADWQADMHTQAGRWAGGQTDRLAGKDKHRHLFLG